MDSEDTIEDNIDSNIETEDVTLSDAEDNAYEDKNYAPLNIDYNSRVFTEETTITCHETDNCDMQFRKSWDSLNIRKTEDVLNTSSDEFEISDDDLHGAASSMQHVDLKGHAVTADKKHFDSFVSKKYVETSRKKDYDTDAEYISEEEILLNSKNESSNTIRLRNLSSGLPIAQITSVGLSEQQMNPFASNAINTIPSIIFGDKNMHELSEEPEAPLMTCLEFLKSDVSEDEGTDVEDLSTDSLCGAKNELLDLKTRGINETGGLELDSLPFVVADPINNGLVPCSVPFLRNRRRSSAAEFLTEDETIFLESEIQRTNRKRTKRYIYKQQLDNGEHSDESLTDEEILDVKGKEWTETDESGGMRQITQIKTETSIKLEGNEVVTATQVHPVADSPASSQTHSQCYDPNAQSNNNSLEELRMHEDTYENRKFSVELCKKEEFKEALRLEDDERIHDDKKLKERPSNLLDTSSAVDSHIKSEILREEIDQSIEESPLEVKQIAEDLKLLDHTHSLPSEDHKSDVYKHIRTEIFTQVLGEDIESGSPERKELYAFSSKQSNANEDQDLKRDLDTGSHTKKNASEFETEEQKHLPEAQVLSAQVSEESYGQADEISFSESATVEHDDHLVEYEEAKDEHSLTEQLEALASDSIRSSKVILMSDEQLLNFETHDIDHMSPGMSSSMSDLEIQRRAKDIVYTRHDKKEIRSLKSTKQVSTIEEHSSIESCDSPQELMLQDLPEKHDSKKNGSEQEDEKSEIAQQDAHLGDPSVTVTPADDSNVAKKLPEDPDVGSSKETSPDFQSDHGISRQSDDAFERSAKISRSDSKSSHGKKSDSDAEGSKIESIAESVGKRKEESCSSSGETESPYYSVETSDSGRTPRSTPAASRPCSSEFEINVFSAHGSEYETCVTSQEASGEGSGSYATAISSQEISYATACSSFSHSSRESAYSVDSESSGHLASVEVSSEASETLVPSAQEMELEFGPDLEMPVLDEEPHDEDEDFIKEPYDMDIPEAIIRSGIEMPFMKTWELKDGMPDDKMKQLPQQWTWQYAAESEVLNRFETVETSDSTSEVPSVLTSADVQTIEGCSNRATTLDPVHHLTQTETVPIVHDGPSHRRSASSVIGIIPDKENVEQSNVLIEEEQLSVSESSATHSEQTWQTVSVDTAVQLSSNAPVPYHASESSNLIPLSDPLHETPPEKELTTEQPHHNLHPESSYLQLNGPVEVEYNPDYDNPDGEDSELRSDQDHPVLNYETDGLQFELEIDGTSANVSNDANTSNGTVRHESGSSIFDYSTRNLLTDTNEVGGAGENISETHHTIHSSADYEGHVISESAVDADKPEAQQEQSMSFRGYDVHQISESLVCPDLTSYLPESDQCDLLSGGADSIPPSYESEVNIPCSESLQSSELSFTETRTQLLPDLHSTDSLERADIVDTSPEDERYEYKSLKSTDSGKSAKEEKSLDFQTGSSLKCDESSILAESDYVTSHFASKYDDLAGSELYTHQEEEEFDLRESDVYPSPIPSVDDDKQSTPSSEAFHGRKFFPRSGDTSAASSLQEFERLEAEISAGRLSRSSIDSNEKMTGPKSSEHDDVSMCSLTEFEKLEKECVESENIDRVIVDDIMLSEIEEGLESQCSDAIEILQESLHDGSDSSDYERRRINIEEIIKVAQSNVEKFQEETLSEGITSDECTVLLKIASESQGDFDASKESSKEEGNTDAEESEPCPLISETDNMGHDSSSSGEKNYADGKGDCMVSSTDSIDPSSSTATHATYQFETDSVVSSSINSAQASGEECTMVSSTDTLEPEPKLTYSVGDSTTEEKTVVTSHSHSEESSLHAKGALACKLEELKELQSTNGAKEQMEMFLSKLTDESVLMDDFTSHSFPDTVDDSELHTAPDGIIKSTEAAEGCSMSGNDSILEGDDLISRTTATTTTRIVTTVVGADGEECTNEQVIEDGDDLRHSVEVILNQFMSDDTSNAAADESKIEQEE